MTNPLVSILVTVYNREEYLSDCLNSIIASNFKDYEVIIVDDCSTDDSPKIARSFSESDPARFHFFRNNSNIGQFANRNEAARKSKGLFLKYIDSDDVLYPYSIDIMVSALLSDANAALSLSYPTSDPSQPFPFSLSPNDCYEQEFLGRGCLSVGPSASLIKRSNFFNVGGFRDVGVASDLDLWYRLSARDNTVFHQPGLVWWRRHSNQAYHADTASEDYLIRGNAIRVDAITSDVCPLSFADRKVALARVKQHFARRILKYAIQNGRLSRFIRIWRESGLTFTELLRGFQNYR